jgi:phosphate transport system substrate-binding protein
MLNGKMPAEDIRVVYRSDQSGTTDNFQQYLQAASGGAWNRGTGKVFRGGVGQGAPGNEGTSAMVAKTEGTISYNEWSYAINQNMAAADIKTSAGIVHIGDDWVGKTLAGAKVSGQGDNIIVDLSAIYNTTDKGVYPIMLASYELVCSKNPDAEVGKAVKAFLQSTITVGQTDLTKSGYVPLPPDFQSKVAAAVSNLA